jgi:hypothetical protein
MKKFSIIVIMIAAVGCGKGKATANLEATYNEARSAVAPGEKWDAAIAKIEKQLGPAKIKNETEAKWAAVDGDSCHNLTISRNRGAETINGADGGSVNAAVEGPFNRCKSVAETKVN